MSVLDKILKIVEKTGYFEKENRRDSLRVEMQKAARNLINHLETLNGYIQPDDYREALVSFHEVEQRAEKELRSFAFVLGPGYLSFRSAYEEFRNAEKIFLQKIQENNDRLLKSRIDEAYPVVGTVEGHKLDFQQMACIVKESHSHLVIAGAGTGKTTTIIGKVKYLLATHKIAPQELLILSFTNASASEMKSRLYKETGEKLYVATFHKLGYDIIRRAEGITPRIYEKGIQSFVRNDLSALSADESFQSLLKRYLLFNRVPEKSEFEFESYGDYREYLETNPPTTIREEHVKSYGEMIIANFLAEHGIQYRYEAEYPVDTRTEEYGQYRPDFYLPDHEVYIEYFGVDRLGNVPAYFSEKGNRDASVTYREGMAWKRSLHEKHGTKLIEFYAYENMEGTLLSSLQEKLSKAGISLKQLSLAEILSQNSQNQSDVLSAVSEIIATVISLARNKKLSAEELLELCKSKAPRQLVLAELVTKVMSDYGAFLKDNELIDFTDMLYRAEALTETNRFVHKFRYVIVDEYQDISTAQHCLLKAMRKQADFELFCVGDDWQSIYQFAGSDIGYILYFNQYWGRSELSKIETTYRFAQRLTDISGHFIMENPNQIKKYIRTGNNSESMVIGHISGYTDALAMRFMAEKMDDLPKDSSVFLIGRYQFDIDLLRKCSRFSLEYDNVNGVNRVTLDKRPDLRIEYYTAHRSKGLQADYVFIINNRNSYMGFPSRIQNPPIAELLLEHDDKYPNAEERRLYYVALTRARKRVYLVTSGNNISPFAKDLIERYKAEIKQEAWICPWCGGRLQKIQGPYGEFYGCSNYKNNGCRYKRIIRQ